jgi:hypothetical protein
MPVHDESIMKLVDKNQLKLCKAIMTCWNQDNYNAFVLVEENSSAVLILDRERKVS